MTSDDHSGDDLLPVVFLTDAPDLADPQFDRGFNYGALPWDAARALRERRAQIVKTATKTTEAMIAIGRDLIAAKKLVPHGQFVQWVQTECGFSIRTAQNYITISKFSVKYAFVAHLPPGAALSLARWQGRGELAERIARSVGTGRAPTEEELYTLYTSFKRMRALRPKDPRRRNPRVMFKAVEKQLPLYHGYPKSEYVRLNYEGLKRFGGFLALYTFAEIVESGTVAETLQLVEAELRRVQLQVQLSNQAALSTEDTQ